MVEPAHILKALHPQWSTANPKPSYADFQNALPPQHLPLVTVGPFAVTEYKTDQLMIFRRNPYYWKVDENGLQLPYFDEIQFTKGTSGVGRDLCTEAGNCDVTNLENPSSFVDAMTKAAAPDSPVNITWSNEELGYSTFFNYSVDYGTQNDRDKAVRQLNRDLRFRMAMAYATDRDGIAQSIMRGPFLRGWAGGILPGCPYFDKTSVVYYPYDPPSAKLLLADMGLKDTNNDGILEWTSGTQAGQSVVLAMLVGQDQAESVTIAEALVTQWAQVGIKINMQTLDSTAFNTNQNNGTWDILTTREGSERTVPQSNVTALAPITPQFMPHREGSTPRVLMNFEQSMIDIVNKFRGTFTQDGRVQLISQLNNLGPRTSMI